MWVGVLAFRWLAFAWMVLSNLLSGGLVHPVPAWIALGLTGAWNLWFTFRAQRHLTFALWSDLVLSFGLVALSGWVVAPGDALNRAERTFFATIYPGGTAVTWGACRGWKGGLFSALVLSVATALARPLNGFPLTDLPPGEWVGLANGVVYYLVAGVTPGVMATTLDRAAEELDDAIAEAVRARERAARLGERADLAGSIHDSVLNVLTRMLAEGQELGQKPSVTGAEVRELTEVVGEQVEALRALILREPLEPTEGAESLEEALEDAATEVVEVPVSVNAKGGPIRLPARDVAELGAAVRQALENVVEHARASRAGIFAEAESGWLLVSVWDDGVGFLYDEERLKADGKAGLLRSMKGRVESLGGRMRVMSAEGLGTAIEFRVPVLTEPTPRPERLRERWQATRVAARIRRGRDRDA